MIQRGRRREAEQTPYHPDYAAMWAFWMADDDELQNMIERLATTSQAHGPSIGYLLAESDRRALRRSNESVVAATEQMARSSDVTGRLTWALVLLTVVLVIQTTVLILIDTGVL